MTINEKKKELQLRIQELTTLLPERSVMQGLNHSSLISFANKSAELVKIIEELDVILQLEKRITDLLDDQYEWHKVKVILDAMNAHPYL